MKYESRPFAHLKTSKALRLLALLAVLSTCLPMTSSAQDDTAASDLYLQARERLIDEHLEPALELFRRVVEEYPASAAADDAQYYVGYCLERQGLNRQAIQAFDRLLERWPDSVRSQSAISRRSELAAHEQGSQRDTLDWLRRSDTSWEVRRDAAYAMARAGNLDGADILEEALRREGSGRKSDLIRTLAPMVDRPEARRILVQALEPSHSTSVQMQAIESLAPALSDSRVVVSIGESLSPGAGHSTSVQLKALKVLAKRRELATVRVAIARALQPGGSTSVQIAACDALEGHLLEPEVVKATLSVYQQGVSTSVQIKGLQALDRENNNPKVIAIVEAALQPGLSTSVQLRAIELAESSSNSRIQAAASVALRPQASTSVQLKALKSLVHTDAEQAVKAIEGLLSREGVSTSVQLQALSTLSDIEASPGSSRAIASVLSAGRSTSVQLRALDLAVPLHDDPEIHLALMRLLAGPEISTSVQLKALGLLGRRADDPAVAAIVGRALVAQGSTSVQLKSVDILSRHTESRPVRISLAGTLESGRSTSVVLESLRALERRISEPEVRQAFLRTMEEDNISSTARVRAAKALLRLHDDRLSPVIADAMEDVIAKLTRHRSSWTTSHDLVDDALDVLDEVDPKRAKKVADRID